MLAKATLTCVITIAATLPAAVAQANVGYADLIRYWSSGNSGEPGFELPPLSESPAGFSDDAVNQYIAYPHHIHLSSDKTIVSAILRIQIKWAGGPTAQAPDGRILPTEGILLDDYVDGVWDTGWGATWILPNAEDAAGAGAWILLEYDLGALGILDRLDDRSLNIILKDDTAINYSRLAVTVVSPAASPQVLLDGYLLDELASVPDPAGLAADSAGNVYVGNANAVGRVRRIDSLTGTVTEHGQDIEDADALAVDVGGILGPVDAVYVGGRRLTGESRITRIVDGTNEIYVEAQELGNPSGLEITDDGHLLAWNGRTNIGGELRSALVRTDGATTEELAVFMDNDWRSGLTTDTDGLLYTAALQGQAVYQMTQSGAMLDQQFLEGLLWVTEIVGTKSIGTWGDALILAEGGTGRILLANIATQSIHPIVEGLRTPSGATMLPDGSVAFGDLEDGLIYRLRAGDILDDGLIGYWSFDEGSGSTAHDDSSNGNDGAIVGATWHTGQSQSSLSFDGSDDYINAGSSPSLSLLDAFTMSAWIRTNSSQIGRVVYRAAGGIGRNINYQVWANSSSCTVSFGTGIEGNTQIVTADLPEDANWHHIVGSFSDLGDSLVVYVDGALAASTTTTEAPYLEPDSTVLIGCGDGSGSPGIQVDWPFDGLIDEVRIYDRALSEDEIRYLYLNPGGQAVVGPDPSIGVGDVSLDSGAPHASAEVTVHNYGGQPASGVRVELFKHVEGSGFTLAGSTQIPKIQPLSQATTSVTFTPGFAGQELRVGVSLPNPTDDIDPSNNVVETIWSTDGVSPVIPSVHSDHDGDDSLTVAGRFISGIEANNEFLADVVDPQGNDDITGVEFTLSTEVVVGTKTWNGEWKAAFDIGQLVPGDHTLSVVATDASGNASDPKQITIEVIALPSWAEEWNSTLYGTHYKLAGFIPVEWRLDYEVDPSWLLIGGLENRFRAGLYTTAEVGLDGRIFDSNIAPAIYVLTLGFPTIDFKVDNEPLPSVAVKLFDFADPGNPYTDYISLYNALDIVPVFDDETLELVNLGVNFEKSFTHDLAKVPLTPGPVPFTLGGWPMSFQADLTFTPGVDLNMTVTAEGNGLTFVQPTSVKPNLNIQIAGTVNVVEAVVAAIGASLQPNVNFAYDIAWVMSDWQSDWVIRFFLDICARLRLGWGVFSKDFDLGCVTLFDTSDPPGRDVAGGTVDFSRTIDPLGVLNRPSIISSFAGNRLLVYAGDNPEGNPAEIFAQLDPGSGTWGAQMLITDDLYADLDPTVAYTQSGDALAVWTKVETLADDVETSTIDQLIGTQDLYWSKWDGSTWSAPAALTDDTAADGLAKVAFSGAAADGLALWCRDEASDFDDVTDDEIVYATWNGTAWAGPAPLTSDTLGDRSVAVCYRRGTTEAVAVWSKETNSANHLSTAYFAEWDGVAWTTPEAIPGASQEWVAQVNVAPLSDGRVLAAWAVQAEDGWQIKLVVFDPAGGWGEIETVQHQVTLVDGLQLRVSDNDVAHLFWHGYELDDDLFGVSRDFAATRGSGGWVGPTKLTAGDEIEWQPTGILDSDDELAVLFAREASPRRGTMRANTDGLPDELGSTVIPGDGNWTVTNDDLTVLGDPWVGETVNVEATLSNTGTTDTVQTSAQFWLGDPVAPDSERIGAAITVEPIPALATTTITSDAVGLDEVGHVDVYLVIAPPVAEGNTADNQAALGIDVINNDTTPPQVAGAEVTALRDEGRLGVTLVITFDEAMTPITAQDVALVGETSGQSVPDQVWMNPTNDVLTVVVEDRLSRDRYALTVAGRVTDDAGNQLDGNADGAGGDDYTFEFSLLAGDYDNDSQVDLNDFAHFPGCVTGPNAGPATGDCGAFYFDSDDDVDLVDFGKFQATFTGSR